MNFLFLVLLFIIFIKFLPNREVRVTSLDCFHWPGKRVPIVGVPATSEER